MNTRQPKVQTQLGRAAFRIFAANDRLNQILIENLDPAAWRAQPPGKTRTIAAISSRTCTMSAPSGSGLPLRTSRFRRSSTARAALPSRPARDWPQRRSLLGDAR